MIMPPVENKISEPLEVTRDVSPPVMVHVIAPATLPEGYTFEAQIGGDPEKTFTVSVPEGGVKEGDTFLAPLPDDLGYENQIKAPTGHWKDGVCDCCTDGVCHPAICCGFWCQQIAMGQVMQRLGLTWLGYPGPEVSTRNTFCVVLTLVICYTIYDMALGFISNPDGTEPAFISALNIIGAVLFTAWSLFALCKTRESLREKYSIPEERCTGCEDMCCACFCPCCSVCQMLRHTGEYETYRGSCCTETGLANGAAVVV